MIAALFLLLQAAAGSVPALPQDWTGLPMLRYARSPGDEATLANFVRDEVRAGRCAAARQTPAGWIINVDIAVLVQPGGTIRRTTPRAIACPSVEQYAAGIVFSRARGNLDATMDDGWYRTTMTFAWR